MTKENKIHLGGRAIFIVISLVTISLEPTKWQFPVGIIMILLGTIGIDYSLILNS